MRQLHEVTGRGSPGDLLLLPLRPLPGDWVVVDLPLPVHLPHEVQEQRPGDVVDVELPPSEEPLEGLEPLGVRPACGGGLADEVPVRPLEEVEAERLPGEGVADAGHHPVHVPALQLEGGELLERGTHTADKVGGTVQEERVLYLAGTGEVGGLADQRGGETAGHTPERHADVDGVGAVRPPVGGYDYGLEGYHLVEISRQISDKKNNFTIPMIENFCRAFPLQDVPMGAPAALGGGYSQRLG